MRECDLLIVGTGLAGLVAALASAPHLRVLIITKATIDESNTYYAQGGIAAALGTDDSPDRHFQDTISVGAAISNRSAVRALVNSARDAITELIAHGVSFDTHGDQLARGLEAAHSVPRILHSGGAATGLAIQTALSAAARSSAIEIIENAQMLDLLVEGGRCRGA
ncbi:MAG: FAD-binding protein, partial [Chloroflexota bacterium]|nr:FAD-binding protein [Chloroflexota bacterium]